MNNYKWVRVKFNAQTKKAIVLMFHHDEQGAKKFVLTNSGEWQELEEGQLQETIKDIQIYDWPEEDQP